MKTPRRGKGRRRRRKTPVDEVLELLDDCAAPELSAAVRLAGFEDFGLVALSGFDVVAFARLESPIKRRDRWWSMSPLELATGPIAVDRPLSVHSWDLEERGLLLVELEEGLLAELLERVQVGGRFMLQKSPVSSRRDRLGLPLGAASGWTVSVFGEEPGDLEVLVGR